VSDGRWTAADVPGQRGRTIVITGANTGLGFHAARILAAQGADVVLACRNLTRAAAAADQIRTVAPGTTITTLELDLASQASVREAAERLCTEHQRIDVLINNAGGLRTRREVTEDGFESTLATNHLGAFTFTGMVLPRMMRVSGSRVVTVTSIAHRRGRIHFNDLQLARGFRPSVAYAQSKLANLMFSFELDRRLKAAGAATVALAAHPGNARTELSREMNAVARFILGPHAKAFTSWFLQDPELASLGMVRAAVDPDANGADCFGPSGWAQFTGPPTQVECGARAHDEQAQRLLWSESARLTGVEYPLPGPPL
jgi:NAD(P)-dependent dehydrogenase (short-subunit alcohol dehydrogenase family)